MIVIGEKRVGVQYELHWRLAGGRADGVMVGLIDVGQINVPIFWCSLQIMATIYVVQTIASFW